MPRPPRPRPEPVRRARFLESLAYSAKFLRAGKTVRELAEAREDAGLPASTTMSAHQHIRHLQRLGCAFEIREEYVSDYGPKAKRYRLTHVPPGLLPEIEA